MDMPCPCPECGEWIELNDMVRTDGKICDDKLVCEECYDKLENEEE